VTTPPPPWQAWAPPLDPPTSGGLPLDQAQAIAEAVWDDDPHLCAALMWESYAAMLPPTPVVSAVSTGAQSVSYSPAAPVGDAGLAIARADWHRSFVTGQLVSVPLVVAPPPVLPAEWAYGGWWGVDVEGEPPVVAFTWSPLSPGPDTAVTFDGSASQPGSAAAALTRFDWLFDTYEQLPDAGPVATWTTPSGHGSYFVRLIVTDDAQQTAQLTQVITT
jgi:hypothetical protein